MPSRQDDGFTDAVLMIAIICVIILAINGLWQLALLAWHGLCG